MCNQHFLRFLSFRVRSRIALLYFFFLFWIWNKFVYEKILLYSQLSLTKHLLKTDHPRLVLPPSPPPPAIVQSLAVTMLSMTNNGHFWNR